VIFVRSSRATTFAIFALACVAFTFALAPGFARRADADDRVFAIGVDQPLSGIDGTDGVPSRNAVLLAIEQENARRFPGGFHAILEDLDDSVQGKHDPAQGALNFKTLVADDRVLAEIGPLNSNVAKAQIPISNATSLAMISNGATAIELTQGAAARTLRTSAPDRVAFFRVCASDDRQGGLVARFAIDHGWKTVYVVDDNESYGRGVADVFAASYVRDGGTLIGREHILPFQFDFKPLLTKVAAMHPQAVFFGGITSTGGGILRKEMGDVGMANVPYLGGDGLDSPQFINLAGSAANGTYYTIGAPEFRKLPGAQPFRAAFRARFHSDPDAYATDAYAGAKIALEAIRGRLAADPRALPSREDVREAIAATHDVVTPLGRIRFDPSGDIEKPTLSVYRIVHGATEFVLQTTAR
jgi:branched-chain amino acid transport system substrate-binding protein